MSFVPETSIVVGAPDLRRLRSDLIAESITRGEINSWDVRIGEGLFIPSEGLECALCRGPFLRRAMAYGYWPRSSGRQAGYVHRYCWQFAVEHGRAPRDDDRDAQVGTQ